MLGIVSREETLWVNPDRVDCYDRMYIEDIANSVVRWS